MLESAPDGTPAFVLNYREILGGCGLLQFALDVDVLQVQADVIGAGLEQLGHEALGQPDGLGMNEDTDMDFLVVAGIQQEGCFSALRNLDGWG